MNRNELTNKRMTSSAGPSSADESPQPPAKRRMLNKQRHELAVPTTPTHAHSLPEESSDSTQDVSINSSSQTTTISPAAQMLAVPSSTALTSPRPQAVTFSSSHAFQKPQSLQQTHHSPLVAVRIDSQSSVPSHRPPAIPQPALPPHPQCRAVLDGYKVLRNAVRPELVSTLNAIVENGLPIQGRGDSYAMFVPPVQGYMIRDEFMNVRFSCSKMRSHLGRNVMSSGLCSAGSGSLLLIQFSPQWQEERSHTPESNHDIRSLQGL